MTNQFEATVESLTINAIYDAYGEIEADIDPFAKPLTPTQPVKLPVSQEIDDDLDPFEEILSSESIPPELRPRKRAAYSYVYKAGKPETVASETKQAQEKEKEKTEEEILFECNICLDTASNPVVTMCGHLYCWPCFYVSRKVIKQLHLRNELVNMTRNSIETRAFNSIYYLIGFGLGLDWIAIVVFSSAWFASPELQGSLGSIGATMGMGHMLFLALIFKYLKEVNISNGKNKKSNSAMNLSTSVTHDANTTSKVANATK
ncbi:hypothetical protein HDV01_001254 [Terramyces sp. JEL0728]|nr:hypothetical protein HDV01_001254 [Terramyces sp. JEL0728]